jgi:hypothetical protein
VANLHNSLPSYFGWRTREGIGHSILRSDMRNWDDHYNIQRRLIFECPGVSTWLCAMTWVEQNYTLSMRVRYRSCDWAFIKAGVRTESVWGSIES